jgi:hypothetical protein
MAKRLWSVFTDDMDHCYFTGYAPVERHHIFHHTHQERMLCEKYGFIIPLRQDLHPNGVKAGKQYKEIDDKLKRMAQEYFEEHYGTREEFRQQFFKSNL